MKKKHGGSALAGAALAIISAGATAWLAGCAGEQFEYVPAERPVTNNKRTNQAVYSVPEGAPEGSVRVSSAGVNEIKPSDGSASFNAIHVKIAVSNEQSHSAWTLDPGQLTIALPNQPQTAPAVVRTDPPSSGPLEIKPGQLRMVDLYFPIPAQKEEKNLPEFDFHWKLQAGQELVQETTLFDRVQIPDAPTAIYPYGPYPYAMGWGPVWWGP